MARIVEEYREKRIIVITSPRSATAQFEHNNQVHQIKMKNIPLRTLAGEEALIQKLFEDAAKEVDKVLGPLKADHLMDTKHPLTKI